MFGAAEGKDKQRTTMNGIVVIKYPASACGNRHEGQT